MRAALSARGIDVLTPSIDLQQFAHHSNYVRSLAFVGERCAHSQCVPMQQTATNRRMDTTDNTQPQRARGSEHNHKTCN